MRLHSWRHEQPPALFDHVYEEPEELHRAFLVVGVEETRNPTVYRLVLERIEWGRFCAALIGGANVWSFIRDRR
jgi:hypothetical protein